VRNGEQCPRRQGIPADVPTVVPLTMIDAWLLAASLADRSADDKPRSAAASGDQGTHSRAVVNDGVGSLGEGDQDAAAAAGVDVVVGFGDVCQLVAVADLDGEGADGGRGGEIARCLAC
jgi:hypothetical protein